MNSLVAAALKDVPLFSQLPDTDLDALSEQLVERRYPRQSTIFSQGDDGDGLYLVAAGHVAISRLNADGAELTLAIQERGEYFGELALFDQQPRSATAATVDACTLLFLSRAGFRAFLQDHPSAIFACVEVIVHRLRELTQLADEIALHDVRSRLALRLVRLAEQGVVAVGEAPVTHARGSYRITQQQLANMLGATRESVNKHLNALIDEGLIGFDRGHIRVLQLERLRACSEGMFASKN